MSVHLLNKWQSRNRFPSTITIFRWKHINSLSISIHFFTDNLRALGDFSQKSASLIIIYPTKSCSEIFPIEISSAQPYFKPNRITVIIKRRGIENRVEALKYRYFKKITWPDKGVCTPFKETNFYSKLKLRMPRSSRNTRCCKCCKLNVSSTYSVHIQEQSYSTQSPMITTGIQLIKIP